MSKRIFTIEWDDDLGPMFMNEGNLLICLNSYCPNIEYFVEDITDEIKTSTDSIFDSILNAKHENNKIIRTTLPSKPILNNDELARELADE